MKSILLNKISATYQQSFIIKPKIYPQAYSLWHHHKEYEILYIVKNSGTAYVGDKIFPYQNGTLMLFSASLPHMFVPKLDPTNNHNNGIDAYVLHFSIETINAVITMFGGEIIERTSSAAYSFQSSAISSGFSLKS